MAQQNNNWCSSDFNRNESSGTYIDIGTVTTDGYYGTFGLAWTPTAEGTYKIIASFEGDESYGSSAAATYVTLVQQHQQVDQ